MVNLHSIYDSIGASTYTLEDNAIKTNIMVYGYGFVVLNVLQGVFILTFHCLQNEKVCRRSHIIRNCKRIQNIQFHRQIQRAYRKFILAHSWLPQCLLCGSGPIVDGDQAQNPNGGSATNNMLTGSPHQIGGSFMSASTQSSTNPHLSISGVNQQVVGMGSSGGTLIRHQTLQSQRHHNTLRNNQRISPSTSMINADGQKQYDIQKSEMNYPHSGQSSQQFHQLHGMIFFVEFAHWRYNHSH